VLPEVIDGCAQLAVTAGAQNTSPQETPPESQWASCKAWYAVLAAIVASLLALISTGQPQPMGSATEVVLHSSVEPLVQARALSTAAAYSCLSVLHSLPPQLPPLPDPQPPLPQPPRPEPPPAELPAVGPSPAELAPAASISPASPALPLPAALASPPLASPAVPTPPEAPLLPSLAVKLLPQATHATASAKNGWDVNIGASRKFEPSKRSL
jgi:hypothetical protein